MAERTRQIQEATRLRQLELNSLRAARAQREAAAAQDDDQLPLVRILKSKVVPPYTFKGYVDAELLSEIERYQVSAQN